MVMFVCALLEPSFSKLLITAQSGVLKSLKKDVIIFIISEYPFWLLLIIS